MAYAFGRASRFRIADAGGVMRDLSAHITEVSGLPGERALNEVTALGDSGARFIPAADSVAFTLRGLFDDAAQGGPDAVLGALRYHGAPTSFEYAPAGISAGKARYSGSCWVAAYRLSSHAGEPVSWEATLQVDGGTTRGAYPDSG